MMVVLYALIAPRREHTSRVRLSHVPARTRAVFDDPNLVSHGGLVPVVALAERCGLPGLLAKHVRPGGECGVNAPAKAGCLVAGMAAGADSIDDMGLLRHGAMDMLFAEIRAPSTLGSHLRCYTWGNVLQLEKADRELLARLSRQAPLLPGADVLAFIDLDATHTKSVGGLRLSPEVLFSHNYPTPLCSLSNELLPSGIPKQLATRNIRRLGMPKSSRRMHIRECVAAGYLRTLMATGTGLRGLIRGLVRQGLRVPDGEYDGVLTVADLERERIRRKPALGRLINECSRAA
jgi:hypothetical protein